MNADADLIAAGLLLDLKTVAARPSLDVKDMCQLIGYALLDFVDGVNQSLKRLQNLIRRPVPTPVDTPEATES